MIIVQSFSKWFAFSFMFLRAHSFQMLTCCVAPNPWTVSSTCHTYNPTNATTECVCKILYKRLLPYNVHVSVFQEIECLIHNPAWTSIPLSNSEYLSGFEPATLGVKHYNEPITRLARCQWKQTRKLEMHK